MPAFGKDGIKDIKPQETWTLKSSDGKVKAQGTKEELEKIKSSTDILVSNMRCI